MQASSKKQSNFLVTAFLISFAYFLIILLMDKAII